MAHQYVAADATSFALEWLPTVKFGPKDAATRRRGFETYLTS